MLVEPFAKNKSVSEMSYKCVIEFTSSLSNTVTAGNKFGFSGSCVLLTLHSKALQLRCDHPNMVFPL